MNIILTIGIIFIGLSTISKMFNGFKELLDESLSQSKTTNYFLGAYCGFVIGNVLLFYTLYTLISNYYK